MTNPAAETQTLPEEIPALVALERAYRPEQARENRAEVIRALYRKLGSWAKVGDAIGLPRQDAWKMAQGAKT